MNANVQLAALVDVDQDAVTPLAKEYGARAFTDYREMLDAGVVDAVSIATPHHLHTMMGLACLEAGVHVLMEKPLANRVSEADALVAAARARKLKLAVNHQYRVHRLSLEMKRVLDSGTVGRILRVLWTWLLFRSDAYYRRDRWRSTWDTAGGGVIMYQASHDLDLLCWMIGKPALVSAVLANQLHSSVLDDIASAWFQFTNGAVGSFQASINSPKGFSVRQVQGDKGVLMLQDVASLYDDEDEIVQVQSYEDQLSHLVIAQEDHEAQPGGTYQTITLKKERSTRWSRTIERVNRRLLHKEVVVRLSPRAVLLNDFVDSIISNRDPLVTGESARDTIEVINACILSALRKRIVQLPLDTEQYDDLFMELTKGSVSVPRFR
jgi:predicted dehydrogenase